LRTVCWEYSVVGLTWSWARSWTRTGTGTGKDRKGPERTGQDRTTVLRTVQYSAVQCGVLQCSAVHYTVHGARYTEHSTRRTVHEAGSTENGARYTEHGTRSMTDSPCPGRASSRRPAPSRYDRCPGEGGGWQGADEAWGQVRGAEGAGAGGRGAQGDGGGRGAGATLKPTWTGGDFAWAASIEPVARILIDSSLSISCDERRVNNGSSHEEQVTWRMKLQRGP
jgi:hypothetical protein